MKMTISYKHFGPLSHLRPLAVATLALLVSGCMVGPDYHRPQVNVPATYAELPGWTQAEPAAAGPKGEWWTAFNDPLIDQQIAAIGPAMRPLVSQFNAMWPTTGLITTYFGEVDSRLSPRGHSGLDIAAPEDPIAPQRRQPFAHVVPLGP